jgi:hypothetical protein
MRALYEFGSSEQKVTSVVMGTEGQVYAVVPPKVECRSAGLALALQLTSIAKTSSTR